MPDTVEPLAAKSPDAWPKTDPSLLEEGRPALPAFPLQSLPPFWRGWVSETALGAGAPVDYIVQALLASVAGVCGAGVLAQVTETWQEPMILWQALVGGPSSGKTPALEALRRPLAAVEKTAGREKRGPVVIDHDMPFARLLSAANRLPAGALLWRDEPAAWLAALGCNGRGEARALSPLLDTWSPLRTAAGPGSPATKHHRLPRSGAPRRDAARQRRRPRRPLPLCLAAARAVPLLPRAAVLPRERRGERPAAHRPFRRRSRAAAGGEAARIGAEGLRHPSLPAACRPAALRRRRGGVAGQGPRHGGAAGVGAHAAGPGGGRLVRPRRRRRFIIGDRLFAACRLWEYFRAHARAVLGRAFPSDGEQPMRQVLAWIRARGAAQVSREDVRRDALGQAPNARQALQVIQSLERAGFLRKADYKPDGAGRPPLRWDVNPSLIGESLAEIAEIAEIPAAPPAA